MIRSNLCDYSDAYIYVKGTITIRNTETAAAPNNRNKKVIFENCVSFINCISGKNNTQVDDAHDIDVIMPMYKCPLFFFLKYLQNEKRYDFALL